MNEVLRAHLWTVVVYPFDDDGHPSIYSFDNRPEAQAFVDWIKAHPDMDEAFLAGGEVLGVWEQTAYTLEEAKESLGSYVGVEE